MIRLEMKKYNTILTEMQYIYNFTDEEMLTSDQSRMIEQAKFTYSPLSKVFEKQIKVIEDQGVK